MQDCIMCCVYAYAGLEQDIRTLQEGRASSSHTRRSIDGDADGSDREASACQGIPHVMLSYEWGSQQSVLLLKQELQKVRGYPRRTRRTMYAVFGSSPTQAQSTYQQDSTSAAIRMWHVLWCVYAGWLCSVDGRGSNVG